ncbi:TolC family protein [Alloacidobacterium dinghuense]|uniref:TolC family protein n=1 Tax=Alloacidobacterium dinghuense TaxID=2763107 RepID=A0A7G8BCD2_9BACT|nr:TolC family protein [Alloacidobacterium dinghuense]QNI30202.1 TolC family protein [Alloacidobacterium dinghuense]
MQTTKSLFDIRGPAVLGLLLASPLLACGQASLTWDQVKTKFESANPALKADELNVQEMKAEEITAYLRPNPQFTLSQDGTQIAPHDSTWTPLKGTYVVPTLSYLHEREHKRELRLESAQEGTQIAASQHEDLERNLVFNLRVAFVSTLQAKAIVDLSRQELDYYDKIIDISRARFKAGDLAQIDLDRIELQRVQYESDLQTAEVNLRTSKIQLLQLLNDRTPVDQFDIQGTFDFTDQLQPLDSFHQIALDNRPDLRAALQAVQQADTNHKLAIANGSTDPTFSGWYTYNSSNNNPNGINTLGASVSIPLRIFDRNQGEKQRTLLDIGRNQELTDATRAQVFGDVDSAYVQVNSNLILLRPYKDKYLAQAVRVRETVTYAWQHGGASLMDFLNAQSDYRNVQMAYLQLIGAYLTAAGQLNLAVGREVIQ